MKRALHLVALAAVAVAVLVVPAGAQAASVPAVATPAVTTAPLSGLIVLRSRATGLCIDDSAAGLRGFGCQPPAGSALPYQEFTMTPDGGYDVLKSVATGLCLDDSTGAGLRGFGCQPLAGSDIAYQEFTVTQLGGYVVLRNRSTGLCIDDSAAGLRGYGCQNQTGSNIQYQEFSSPTRDAMVAAAQSQVGFQSAAGTYCNPYTAYWGIGPSCGGGQNSEEWCADFVAWAWDQSGSPFVYGYGTNEIDAAAVSFYLWGLAHGTWHAANSGYQPQPGDAAVYGLSGSGASAIANHVAIVTGGTAASPNVINGDWWNDDNIGGVVAANGQGMTTVGPISGYVAPLP